MPSCCAVVTCNNTHRNCKDKNIIFHKFPEKNSGILKKWIYRCFRKDKFNPKNARMCSEHFMENDYVDDMQNRLLGLPQKRKLKELAVPNVKLPALNTGEQNSARSERQKRRRILKNAHERLKSLSTCKTNDDSLKLIENHQDKELAVSNVEIPALNTDEQVSVKLEKPKRKRKLQNVHDSLKIQSPCKTNDNSPIIIKYHQDKELVVPNMELSDLNTGEQVSVRLEKQKKKKKLQAQESLKSLSPKTNYNTFILIKNHQNKEFTIPNMKLSVLSTDQQVSVSLEKQREEKKLQNAHVNLKSLSPCKTNNNLFILAKNHQNKELPVPNVKLSTLNTDEQVSVSLEEQRQKKRLQNAQKSLKSSNPCKTSDDSLILIGNHQDKTKTKDCENCNILQKEIEILKLKLITANNMQQVLSNKNSMLLKKIRELEDRDHQLKNIKSIFNV